LEKNSRIQNLHKLTFIMLKIQRRITQHIYKVPRKWNIFSKEIKSDPEFES
jgi:hypothetical protein